MSRTDQYQIHLTRIKDNKDFGVWKTFHGGGADSSELFVRDGYGQARKALGGPAIVDTISCSRTFYPDKDGGLREELRRGVGRDRFTVNRQKLSVDGFAVGAPEVHTGVLKSMKPADSNVGDDTPSVDEYTIEIAPDGDSV